MPSSTCGPLLDLGGIPEWVTVLQMRSHPCQVEKEDYLLQSAGKVLVNVAQRTVGCLSCEVTLLALVELIVHQHLHVLLCKAASQLVIPSTWRCKRLFFPRYRTFHFPWLSFIRKNPWWETLHNSTRTLSSLVWIEAITCSEQVLGTETLVVISNLNSSVTLQIITTDV